MSFSTKIYDVLEGANNLMQKVSGIEKLFNDKKLTPASISKEITELTFDQQSGTENIKAIALAIINMPYRKSFFMFKDPRTIALTFLREQYMRIVVNEVDMINGTLDNSIERESSVFTALFNARLREAIEHRKSDITLLLTFSSKNLCEITENLIRESIEELEIKQKQTNQEVEKYEDDLKAAMFGSVTTMHSF